MKVKLFTILRQLVGEKEIEVDLRVGDTVGSVLTKLVADYPVLGERIFDEDGNLEGFINVFVNGRSIRFLDGLDTSLSEDDVLAIFPPVAGG
jgi:molybdopterin synthase sulfur carrier subunit